jgi:hypothetical protein
MQLASVYYKYLATKSYWRLRRKSHKTQDRDVRRRDDYCREAEGAKIIIPRYNSWYW